MTPTRITLVTLGLLALAISGCAGMIENARPAPPLAIGQRIRLKVPSRQPPRLTGTLVALTGDSLVLRTADGDPARSDTVQLTIPIAAVTMVEKSHGVRGHAMEGCVNGGKVGLIAMLLGFAAGEWVAGDAQSLAVFAGCMAGGAAIGAAVRTEDWRKVPLGTLRVGPTGPAAGAIGLGAGLALRR